MPDIRLCLISGKPLSLINPAQANQAIRQTKEIREKSTFWIKIILTEIVSLAENVIDRDPIFRNYLVKRVSLDNNTIDRGSLFGY